MFRTINFHVDEHIKTTFMQRSIEISYCFIVLANSLLCDLLLTKNMDIVECGVHASGIYGAGFDTVSQIY